jgi:UDP-2,3-diacylglucosamine pyrophosphatase LpxH
MTLPSDTGHDAVLAAWTRDPDFCSVRLVARLADPLLGNQDSSTVYVFVPDLHLISDEKVHEYSYTTNHWEILYRSLFRLSEARTALAPSGGRMVVTQLGDLLDLWRDGHSATRNSVQKIVGSWSNTLKVLYRYPQDPACLRARILVGNHDAAMAGTANWFLRLFLPTETAAAFALALHGDWFDPTERLPDWLSRAGVTIAGRLPQANAYPVSELRPLLDRNAAAQNNYRGWIQQRVAPEVGELLPAAASVALPLEHNVGWKSRHEVHPFLDDAARFVSTYRGGPNASPGFTNVRLVVIGHTHHARISVNDGPTPLVLLDAGAWIEKYRDSTGRVGPNCQMAVVCGNDARIYQLDPL